MTKTLFVLTLVMATAACASNPVAPTAPAPSPVTTPPAPVSPTPGAPARGNLPAPAEVDGLLAVDVVYPREGASIPVRDSTFIFGNIGSGRAQLRINGASIAVQPNGAFLAFLPVPPDGLYQLEATRGVEAVRAERRVRVPPEAVSTGDRTAIIESSITPRGVLAVRRGEPVDVAFRATAGAQAFLLLPNGQRVVMTEDRRGTAGLSIYRAVFPALPLLTGDTSIARPRVGSSEVDRETEAATAAAAAARGETPRTPLARGTGAIVELIVGTDTVRTSVPLNLAVVDPMRPTVAVAADPNPAGESNDGYVVGRPSPGTVSHYFWPNGTELLIDGQRGNEYRVRLTDDLTAWVGADELRLLPSGTPRPASLVSNVSIRSDPGWIDVRFPVSRRLPFEVEERENALSITLFGGTSATDWLINGPRDPLIQRTYWEQPSDGLYKFTIELNRPVWGYQTFFNESGHLILRLRRPPAIDRNAPLRGLLITLDPGHGPPEGRWGPTRLTESQANLDIALALKPMIEAAGGRVQMTRVDTSHVGLYDRPAMATRAGAHIFVSIHNNAVGDGTNPFTNHGTSTYFFHTNSALLARHMQDEIVEEFGLPDLGYIRASLAVVRWPTWMPAVLTEGMFFMMPEQEAALRNPAVIQRNARAHLRALEEFLRSQAR
ncbi:MAG: N-acetylmuramoyl-L-alanine amidase [Gemmatimonadota bacterium]